MITDEMLTIIRQRVLVEDGDDALRSALEAALSHESAEAVAWIAEADLERLPRDKPRSGLVQLASQAACDPLNYCTVPLFTRPDNGREAELREAAILADSALKLTECPRPIGGHEMAVDCDQADQCGCCYGGAIRALRSALAKSAEGK